MQYLNDNLQRFLMLSSYFFLIFFYIYQFCLLKHMSSGKGIKAVECRLYQNLLPCCFNPLSKIKISFSTKQRFSQLSFQYICIVHKNIIYLNLFSQSEFILHFFFIYFIFVVNFYFILQSNVFKWSHLLYISLITITSRIIKFTFKPVDTWTCIMRIKLLMVH